MTRLHFAMEPLFECLEDDAGDTTVIKATRSIGGRDAIKEYVSCRLFPIVGEFWLGRDCREGVTSVEADCAFAGVPCHQCNTPCYDFPNHHHYSLN
jgi:hypothetical protein